MSSDNPDEYLVKLLRKNGDFVISGSGTKKPGKVGTHVPTSVVAVLHRFKQC